jgi:hypothetical protein
VTGGIHPGRLQDGFGILTEKSCNAASDQEQKGNA